MQAHGPRAHDLSWTPTCTTTMSAAVQSWPEATGATYAVSADEHVRRRPRDRRRRPVLYRTPSPCRWWPPRVTRPTTRPSWSPDGAERAVFTGGSLLFGTVGRTDLLGRGPRRRAGGRPVGVGAMDARHLPSAAGVHPTHGFGSFCSAVPCAGTETTIGAERRVNPAAHSTVRPSSKPARRIRRVPRATSPTWPPGTGPVSVTCLSGSGPDPCRGRPRGAGHAGCGSSTSGLEPRYAAGHVPGTVNAGVDGPLAAYVGWTMPWDAHFGLVADDEAELSRSAEHPRPHRPGPARRDSPSADRGPDGRLRLATFDELAAEWPDDVR